MNRKTTFSLALFFVIAILAYLLMSRPKKGVRIGERPRPFAKIKNEQIQKLTLIADGKTIVLVRQKDNWKLSKPVDFPADENAAKTLVEKIEKMEFGDLVTEQKSKHAEYQVDDKSGVHVIISDGKKDIADFYVGKIENNFTMVRANNKNAVFQAIDSIQYAFKKEIKQWRDQLITKFNNEDARKLEITFNKDKISLSRKDEKDSWKIDRSNVKIDQLDASVPQKILSTMASFSASEFADDIKPADAGLDAPQGIVTITLKDNSKIELLIGKNQKDDYWVQKAGNKQIYLVKKHAIESILERPIDFRDKSVLSFNIEDAISFSITKMEGNKKSFVTLNKKEASWVGNNGKPLKSDDNVKNAISALAQFKATGFGDYPANAYGLNKPEWILDIKLKDRTLHQLKVGSIEKDGFYGVMRKGMPDVFTFRKYTLNKILLDPKDYK